MKTVQLEKFENCWYRPGHQAKIILWIMINSIVFKSSIPYPIKFKCYILRLFGANVGNSVVIKPMISIKYPWLLSVGSNSWIGEYVCIENLGKVIIGQNVCISQGAMLLGGNHNYKSSTFDLMIGDIILEDGVWVCARAVVCPGIIMKSHSIITVNSVLTKSSIAFGIYRGNPAKLEKMRNIDA